MAIVRLRALLAAALIFESMCGGRERMDGRSFNVLCRNVL